jgi:hypothetical protein
MTESSFYRALLKFNNNWDIEDVTRPKKSVHLVIKLL